MCKSSLNQNLTQFVPIWNPTDDYYYVNGKRSVKAWLNAVAFWVNGVFGIDVENGVYDSTQGHTVKGFAISGNVLSGLGNTPERVTLVSKDMIDFFSYSIIKANTSLGQIECNVSGYSGTGYLYMVFAPANNFQIGVATQKPSFGNNYVVNPGYASSTSASMTINEITIE